ncbi:hypothetical protein LMTR13_34160 [Bradyrhizobium icense]|uniref:Uncharacterized protein n=1 Tax=Bradyrhizobium icense TaxID=1274631 RepID=A0A1B1UNW0_9BRAD|nr:hypothetical protein LMTR13_34160 [Bradyrhizobium icense]
MGIAARGATSSAPNTQGTLEADTSKQEARFAGPAYAAGAKELFTGLARKRTIWTMASMTLGIIISTAATSAVGGIGANGCCSEVK